MTTKQNLGYSSQLALVMSLIAGSVGSGNIWRFPRVAAANGGGAFIFTWGILTLFICLTIMMGEHVMGRLTRHGAPGAFRDFMGRKFTWMGNVVVLIMAAVAAYYTSVIAWVTYYLALALGGRLFGIDHAALFASVSSGNIITLCLFILILALSAWFAYKGVKVIEKANKFFLPVLFICLIVAAIRSLTLPGASVGLNYLFSFDAKELLNYKIWFEGLSQAIWSAGPGWGLVITLAVFSKKKSDVALTTTTQAFGDAAVSLIAGLAVIPAIFALSPTVARALEIARSGNQGITFIAMPQIFAQMPGGQLISIAFFLALLFAAFSSNICHFLIVSLPVVDSGVKKKKAVIGAFLFMLVLGIPSAWNLNFFNNQDWVAGQMMVLGAFFSCLAMIKFGTKRIRETFINNKYSLLSVGRWWEISIKFIAPIFALVMFLWWSIQSISWDPEWWHPFKTFSLGTFVFQGALMIIISLVFNNKVADSIKVKHYDGGNEFPEVPDNEYS